MDRLPACSSREVVRALERAGFNKTRRAKGTHQTYQRTVGGRKITTVVPLSKGTIPRPVLANIIRLAEMTEEEFVGHLR